MSRDKLYFIIYILLFITVCRGAYLGLSSEHFLARDLVQEYVLGKALLGGFDLGTNFNELRTAITGSEVDNFDHISPHPPTAGLLFLPLTFLTFFQASLVWMFIQIAATAGSVLLLLKLADHKPTFSKVARLSVVVLASSSYIWELNTGQLVSVMCFLELMAIWMFVNNRSYLPGALLGLAFALKLGGWSVLLGMLLQRSFKPALSFVLVVLVFFGSVLLFQPEYSWANYFLGTLPEVTKQYLAPYANQSLVAVFYRFGLEQAPTYLPLILIGCWILFCKRLSSTKDQLMLLMTLPPFASPISWYVCFNALVLFAVYAYLRGVKVAIYAPVLLLLYYFHWFAEKVHTGPYNYLSDMYVASILILLVMFASRFQRKKAGHGL